MKIGSVLPALVASLLFVSLTAVHCASAQVPNGAVNALVGSWTGPISAGGNTQTFVVQLKVDDKGNLQGTLAVPEQGTATYPLSDVQFADNKFNFKIAAVMGEFTSTYATGMLNGLWRQTGLPDGVAVVLKKGDYIAPVHVLKMDTETFGRLAGTWKGEAQVAGPQGEVTVAIALRFETNPHGDRVGFMDMSAPGQNLQGIAMTEATLAAGKLVAKMPGLMAELDANFSGSTMAGQLSLGPTSLPLTLTKMTGK
jgi:hypothetical protein